MDLRRNCDKNVRHTMMNIHISIDPSFSTVKGRIRWVQDEDAGDKECINSFGKVFFFFLGGKLLLG